MLIYTSAVTTIPIVSTSTTVNGTSGVINIILIIVLTNTVMTSILGVTGVRRINTISIIVTVGITGIKIEVACTRIGSSRFNSRTKISIDSINTVSTAANNVISTA